jgi:DNA mismatch endonuclease (patch repair protein)
MSRNRKRDTRPERRVRTELFARGLRYRVNHPVRLETLTVRPDIVFPRQQVAVFVDGCFWHQCPEHGNVPRRNTAYWGPKLRRNIDRDRRVDTALASERWTVIRAWEHEDPEAVASRVAATVASRKR